VIRHQLPAYSPVSARAALLATGQLFDLGDDPRPQLRALLEREYDAKSVLLCGSGTQALTLAIQEALTHADSDTPVALPAYSCFDVATAAVGADVRVSLYDLDAETLSPDLESLERVLKAGAGVVVVAPLYGIPIDWAAIAALARQYDAVLIEDAAQGNGASWKGSPLGSLGEIATLSFGRGKGWTGGTGGAVLFRTSAQKTLKSIPAPEFGRETSTSLSLVAQWVFGRPALYRLARSVPGLGLGETIYRRPKPVTSISRFAAAVLLSTYDASKREAEVRRINSNTILDALAKSGHAEIFQPSVDAVPGYLRLPVRARGGHRSLHLWEGVIALGVAAGYPCILGDLPQLTSRICGPDRSWHGSQTLVRELVTLPTHSRLTRDDVSRVVGVFRDNS